jgi:hypothetical protein
MSGTQPVRQSKFPIVPGSIDPGSNQNNRGVGGQTGNRTQWFFGFYPEVLATSGGVDTVR